MRILSLLARHGTARYPAALADLRAYQRRCLPTARCEVLVVDNAATGSTEEDGVRVIAGSNRAWEFSAWDEGLAQVGVRLLDYDLVHLVTSAFRTLYMAYLDRCVEAVLARVAGHGMALGHLDCYGVPVELFGVRSQCWLRSSFVFLPPAELLSLGSLVGIPDPSRLFSGDPEDPFLADAPISANYRRYILDWLTGEGTGQGTVWHSRFELGPDTLPYFEAKVLAILNEHLLTLRLRRQGCIPVDATWLATQVGRYGGDLELPAIPRWREQLAERDTSPLVIPPSIW